MTALDDLVDFHTQWGDTDRDHLDHLALWEHLGHLITRLQDETHPAAPPPFAPDPHIVGNVEGNRRIRRRDQATARMLDALLGPHCPRCGTRVFPKDQTLHNTKDCTP